jgi:hypothetical protein
MTIRRRQVLQYTGASCLLAALRPLQAGTTSTLRVAEVRDGAALPKFAPGQVLLADTACNSFTGTDIYLYPAWGSPRPYLVSARGALLEFRNPGTGALLWVQSAGLDAAFAGKVLDVADSQAALAVLPLLALPALPA